MGDIPSPSPSNPLNCHAPSPPSAVRDRRPRRRCRPGLISTVSAPAPHDIDETRRRCDRDVPTAMNASHSAASVARSHDLRVGARRTTRRPAESAPAMRAPRRNLGKGHGVLTPPAGRRGTADQHRTSRSIHVRMTSSPAVQQTVHVLRISVKF
jgi:hypothetical protein